MGWTHLGTCLLLVTAVSGLFEDQVGKFDWRHRFVGCPTQIELDRSRHGKIDNILVATKEQALAALSLNTGDIVWRRLQERNVTEDIKFATTDQLIITISEHGRAVRAWEKRKGGLRWTVWLSDTPNENVEIAASGDFVVVLAGSTLYGMDGGETTYTWKKQLPKSDWHSIATLNPAKSTSSSSSLVRRELLLVSATQGHKVLFTPIDSSGLMSDTAVSKPADWFAPESCSLSGDALWCLSSTGTLNMLPLSLEASSVSVQAQSSSTLRAVPAFHTVAVVSSSETAFYQLREDKIAKALTVSGKVDAIGATALEGEGSTKQSVIVAVATNTYDLSIYNLETGDKLAKSSLSSSTTRSPLTSLLLSTPSFSSSSSLPSEWHALILTADCRIESVVLDSKHTTEPYIEWSREEALARVNKVEMLDLPLSELQASIEDEFEGAEGGIVGAFIRRLTTQAYQVKRWLMQLSQQLLSLSSMRFSFGPDSNLADILGAIRNQDAGKSGSRSQPFERDFFNTRKLILLTTLEGVVYGIDNADGRLVWRLNLDESGGSHFAVLKSQLGEEMVPLFVQRTAVHPGFPAIATAVYKDKITHETVFVSFDAMTGKETSRRRTPPVKRVDILPKEAHDHIHPIVIVLKNGKVEFEPEIAAAVAEKMPPIHVLDVDPQTGHLEGFLLDVSTPSPRLDRRWTGDLSFEKDEKAVVVMGKPVAQRVHSRGRVLLDRNVHYKYINPNLVAIASLDEVRQTMSLHLVDAVSGQIVHTGRVTKVSGPVHVVHAEHWVAYSYWSERSRRTELGILELYEGLDEPEHNVFDSLIPTARKPEAIVQSYIFSQGIEAMGVSETEQGATTRSLIMALPFGGLFEVTRRFVDATRPIEFTQEMREEMMIPYMPEIPIATEDMVNYNQSVHAIKAIKSFPSGLESTSLMLAYGLDMFYTRLTPSGTFDILKDDYDTGLISLVLFALFAGSYICKRIVKRNSIKAAWA